MKRAMLIVVVLAAGCGTSMSEMAGDVPSVAPAPATDPATDPARGGSKTAQPGAGVLTAGAWDDNLNFDFYQSYLSAMAAQNLPSVPNVRRSDRLVVKVVDAGGQPFAGAQVHADFGGGHAFEAPSAADGRIYLFPTWQGATGGAIQLTAQGLGQSASASAQPGDAEVTLTLATAAQAPKVLDLAFVLDTTGSMGDELRFLSAEIDAISQSLGQRFPGVTQRFALVVYRDDLSGDAYDVRSFDFAPLSGFKLELAQQRADGGGDYEESPEKGVAAGARLSWSGGAAARLMFHVADAPHHPGREQAMVDAIAEARARGVRIYPVAASGLDERGEFTMRTEAELTGGRYLFLTDDSGVGDAHKEPTLPCYFVTKLDSAIVRMVAMELTGERIEPAASEIIRTGGDPKNGACTLQSGAVVLAF